MDELINKTCFNKEKGYGFGYCILNEPGKEHTVSNALLATGGSGRERNLIYDVRNGTKYAGCEVKGKYSPVNSKCIRTMTPTEWGRLQGFIGYAFKNKDGSEGFSFPENVPNVQQFKQFGIAQQAVLYTLSSAVGQQVLGQPG